MKENIEIVFLKPEDPMDEWDRFVTDSPQGCIFCYSWWLNAVCPGQFEILLLKKESRILAGMPIRKKRIWGFVVINLPPLTQTLGVLFPPASSENYEKNLNTEIEILKVLVESIPKFSIFNISFHNTFTNWLPFYWKGYNQTTFYSYVLEDLSDLDKVFSEFAYSKRKNIKRAENLVEVKEDFSAEDFYRHHKYSLGKQNKRIIYDSDLFYRIYTSAVLRNAGKTWYAIDKNNNVHAAIFVVFDTKTAYFLISSIDPDYRESGAVALLIKKALQYLSPLTKRFDFEGSMDESIGRSFRRFGAKQMTYFNITRNNLALEVLQSIYISIKQNRYH